MTTGNNPKATLSRLIHSDYFDNVIDYYLKDFVPIITMHVLKCKHPKCVYYNKLIGRDSFGLSSLRFNSEYIFFLTDKKCRICDNDASVECNNSCCDQHHKTKVCKKYATFED